MLALNIQLNVTDEKCQKLEDENKQLTARWMARIGQEADEMNLKSRFS
jgi:Autophagy protein 16 (ATG16)